MSQDYVEIWTDGSGNNKTYMNGGCGIVLKYKEVEKHISLGQYINTTTARMELRAILESLKLITDKNKRVKLYGDNQYTIYGISKDWALNWERMGWIGRKNADLWKEILVEIRKFPPNFVEFHWIKGHSKIHYNDIADELAGKGAKFTEIIDDLGQKPGN